MEFDWDVAKAEGNRTKHGVSFTEAATVFDDELQSTIVDHDHSIGEPRYLTIGMSIRGRLLVVYHTNNDRIRIIGARNATKTERRVYEEDY